MINFYKKVRYWMRNFLSEPSNRLLLTLILFLIFIGFILFFIERTVNPNIKSFFDAYWWLIVTIATVGYGDIVPASTFGKVVAMVTIVLGVALFSLVSGSIASILVEWRIKERKGLGKVNFKNHILILGWNDNIEKVIKSVINNFKNKDIEIVLVNEASEEEYDDIKSKFLDVRLKFIHGDFSKEITLKRANIKNAQAVIILADTYGERKLEDCDERTLLSILSIRSLNPDVKIYAEVVREERVKHILRAGADDIVLMGEFNPILLSALVVSPGIRLFLRNVLGIDETRLRVVEIPKNFVGKTFRELFDYIRKEFGGITIGLLYIKKELTINDLLSDTDAIDIFIKEKFQEAQEEELLEEEGKSEYLININPSDDYKIDETDTHAVIIK